MACRNKGQEVMDALISFGWSIVTIALIAAGANMALYYFYQEERGTEDE